MGDSMYTFNPLLDVLQTTEEYDATRAECPEGRGHHCQRPVARTYKLQVAQPRRQVTGDPDKGGPQIEASMI